MYLSNKCPTIDMLEGQTSVSIDFSNQFNVSLLFSALHLAIIHNHQDVVLQLLDVLPQLPPTETPVVDCLNNSQQVQWHL